MTGRLVDISFSLNRKQRITLEVDSDFRNLWDKLNQEPDFVIEERPGNVKSRSTAISAAAAQTPISTFWSTRLPLKPVNRTIS